MFILTGFILGFAIGICVYFGFIADKGTVDYQSYLRRIKKYEKDKI